MNEVIRQWLNGNREYFTGVILLARAGGSPDLIAVLKKGPNDFRTKKLLEELKKFVQTPTFQPSTLKSELSTHKSPSPTLNPQLYESAITEAHTVYKKVMNTRAVLFARGKADQDDYTDPNLPDKIAARAPIAIDVVVGFQQASELYDRAEYVKRTGRLPETEDKAPIDVANIPDSLIKNQLDNARKALSKLRKKEPTAQRIELMQKHQATIENLEKKWHSLKQP